MSTFALLRDLVCETCGTSVGVLPDIVNEDSPVRCSGCGRPLGSWAEIRAGVRVFVPADSEAGADEAMSIGRFVPRPARA